MKLMLIGLIGMSIFLSANEKNINIDENLLKLKKVTSYEDRVKGLTNISNLEWNEGMLFMYKEEGVRKIWMKGMLIPIDIIFLSKNKKIRKLVRNAKPTKTINCKIYVSNKTQYVIELKSGYIEKYKINMDSNISFLK